MKNSKEQITTLVKRMLYIVAGILSVVGSASAQQLSTEAQITVTNNGTPQGTRTLKFGINPAATLGIDIELGEDAFPPFPPTAVFEARFVSNGGSELGEGSPADIRPYSSTTQKDEYKIKLQPGTNGLPVTISWDMTYLKEHYKSVVMKDPFGGVILSVDMLTTATAQITNPALTEVVIEAGSPKDPSSGVEDVRASSESGVYLQNLPNPVTGVTPINYTLAQSATVSLSVVNVSGATVARIIENAQVEGGSHWENVDPADLAAGVYFVVLNADGIVATTRMVIVR